MSDITSDRESYPKAVEAEALFEDGQRHHFKGLLDAADGVYTLVLDRVADHAGALLGKAQVAYAFKRHDDLFALLEKHDAVHGATADSLELAASAHARLNQKEQAERAATRSMALRPDSPVLSQMLSKMRLQGPTYMNALAAYHKTFQPKSYLEIGVDRGFSLELANNCPRPVGVDPDPRIAAKLADHSQVERVTSDAFFASYDGEPFEMIFVDGLHTAEQSLKDMINAERVLAPGGSIFVHDVVPLTEQTQRDDRCTSFWSGTPWKAFLSLIKHRPDLNCMTLPCPPTGLGFIRRADPNSGPATIDNKVEEDMFRFIETVAYEDLPEDLSELLRMRKDFKGFKKPGEA